MNYPDRHKAMKWWDNLSALDKTLYVIKHLKSKNKHTLSRHPNNLFPKEIEEIHKTLKL